MRERAMPQADGVRHRWVEARGVRFHVAEAGLQDATPLLFLHGFPQHWYGWRRLVPLLAGDHRMIMPDLRGFGWSDAPWWGYDTGSRVADVLALLDELGLDRVVLVGHEWGGWVGFHACLTDPERFAGLLALNIAHPWPEHSRMRRHAWRMWYTAFLEYPLVGAAVVRHWPAFTRFLMRLGVTDPGTWEDGETDEYAQSLRSVRRAHASRALHWQFVLRDIPRLATGRARALRLTVPTVIMGGADDFALPPEVLAGGEPYADDLKLEIVEGCGHYLATERPDLVAAAVRALEPASGRVLEGPWRD